MKTTHKWLVGIAAAALVLATHAQTTTLDIDELHQNVLDACPVLWEDVKADIDPEIVTGDVWQSNTADRDAFILFIQTTMGASAPDTNGLNAMADDPSTVAAECATQRIGFLDGLLSKLPADVLTALSSVSEQLQYIGGGGMPADCNASEVAVYNGTQWVCGVASGVLIPNGPDGYWPDCQVALDGGSTGDGVYTIDPDGEGGVDPFQVFCEMNADGGWITVGLNDSTGDSHWASARNANVGELAKCDDLSETLKYYNHLDAGSYSNSDIDFDHNAGDNATVDLTYKNPATGADFAESELDAIRARITTLSTDTRMVTLSCDDDQNDPGHEVYLYDGAGATGTVYSATPGTTGNVDIIWWVHHTDDNESFVDNGLPDPGALPVTHILPRSIGIGHFGSSNPYGGTAWGYEESYVLVK